MNPLRRRLDAWRNRGDAVWCPVCDRRFARFKPAWNRGGALCWRCGSQERHRALWLLLQERDLLGGSLLHFAPEYCLRARLNAAVDRYVTTDLDPAGVDLQLDITALALPDGAFDAVICSHVLEHVDDDAAAMRELRRVTAPGGWCLVLVPLDTSRAETYEDPSITDPAAREAAFLQADHVRLYGRDAADRLAAAGFVVEIIRPREAWGDERMRTAGLLDVDWLFLCR
jgi:SAM-dependent methyltransferase